MKKIELTHHAVDRLEERADIPRGSTLQREYLEHIIKTSEIWKEQQDDGNEKWTIRENNIVLIVSESNDKLLIITTYPYQEIIDDSENTYVVEYKERYEALQRSYESKLQRDFNRNGIGRMEERLELLQERQRLQVKMVKASKESTFDRYKSEYDDVQKKTIIIDNKRDKLRETLLDAAKEIGVNIKTKQYMTWRNESYVEILK